jgi:hypothetical protein
MPDLRSFTLWARELLMQEAAELLGQVYRLDSTTGARLAVPKGHLLETSAAAQGVRQRIEKLLADEVDAGLKREEAVARLIKETAFTHLNRLAAFKLMEARGLIRSPLAKFHEANGFKMWVAQRSEAEALYRQGDMPKDDFGEGPRDRAYRQFLLWQCGELAREIRVLFDPESLPSLLFPRPNALRELIEALNTEERQADWAAGNEETVGWIYQFFNEPDLEQFRGQSARAVPPELVGPRTQNYTPRWVVKFLVHNTLGRLWISMHPDSQIADDLEYLAPLAGEEAPAPLRPVKEIRLLDPATGTMHFGLVAFDLLVKMYAEEMDRAGEPGWPASASVDTAEEIPAAILANNIFGIDIDLRAVQLAAIALYLRAKALSRTALVTQVNLACADVKLFRGQHLNKIADEMMLPRTITRDLFKQFCQSLDHAAQMGTLVRLEKHFERLNSAELRTAINSYAQQHQDEAYFANESVKGLRLLELVSRRYDIVFTNPPYLDNRDYNPVLKKFLADNYKDSSRNLYAAMMRRCVELLADDGRVGILTGQSFMFISSFEKLRELYASVGAIECMAHFDYGLFRARVDTTAFVLRREQLEMERREARGVYFRLVKEPDAEAKCAAFEQSLARRRAGQSDSRIYEYRQGDFAAIAGSPWVYWITVGLRRLFIKFPKLEQIGQPRQGTATSDNLRFLRFWWECRKCSISRDSLTPDLAKRSGSKWFPYMKGGSFQRWYGNQSYTVNWCDDAREIRAFERAVIRNPDYYFRRGVTWTDLTAGKFSARLSPGGFVFDVKGSSAFPEDIPLVLGLLNSSFANYALNLINPTVSYQVGDITRLPVPQQSSGPLRGLVDRAVALAHTDSEEDETTYDFIAPPGWPDGVERVARRHGVLADLEREIDEEVYRLYEISAEDRRAIEDELAAPSSEAEAEESGDASEVEEEAEVSLTTEEMAQQWVSYALGLALGRFAPGEPDGLGRGKFPDAVSRQLQALIDQDGLMVLQRDHPDDLPARILAILTVIHGDIEAGRIVRTVTGGNGDLRDALAAYLTGPFFKAHVKRYRKRPIYWLLQSPKQNYSVYLFHERATDQSLALLQGNRYLGGRIFQLKDRLRQAQVQEEKAEGREKARWRRQAQDLAEELADLEAFDAAIAATNSEPVVTADGQPGVARWKPEFDDGVLLNAAPLYRLTPAWKRADAKLDLAKAWKSLKDGDYPWAKTAMRYWPRETLKACKDNKSYRIAHGLE